MGTTGKTEKPKKVAKKSKQAEPVKAQRAKRGYGQTRKSLWRLKQALAAVWESLWYMAGTEGTGEYKVLAATARGRIGVRQIGGDSYRIRVEPSDTATPAMFEALRVSGWKAPVVGNRRWSFVASGIENAKTWVQVGADSLLVGTLTTLYNSDEGLPIWVYDLIEALKTE